MFEQFNNTIPLPDERKIEYAKYFKRLEVPAKTVLLREGEISKKVFFVERGCMRVWFNNDGKDVTFQFFFEGSTVASIESFRKNIPRPITVETIEPCVLWYAHKKGIQKILEEINEIPAQRNVFIEAIFERTFDYMKHFLSSKIRRSSVILI